MSKLTTKGNRRIDMKIQIMTENKRTIGATNYSPTAVDLKGRPKIDKSTPVSARNIGSKSAATSKTKKRKAKK